MNVETIRNSQYLASHAKHLCDESIEKLLTWWSSQVDELPDDNWIAFALDSYGIYNYWEDIIICFLTDENPKSEDYNDIKNEARAVLKENNYNIDDYTNLEEIAKGLLKEYPFKYFVLSDGGIAVLHSSYEE